jgi:hypothetical protein
MELLLDSGGGDDVDGVDLEARSPLGQTPLHWAVMNAQHSFAATNATTLLLDSGANIEARDHQGNTPLHLAARSHSDKAIRLLLRRGANVNARNRRGETPLESAMDALSELLPAPYHIWRPQFYRTIEILKHSGGIYTVYPSTTNAAATTGCFGHQ